jgi:hypothetical protein
LHRAVGPVGDADVVVGAGGDCVVVGGGAGVEADVVTGGGSGASAVLVGAAGTVDVTRVRVTERVVVVLRTAFALTPAYFR